MVYYTEMLGAVLAFEQAATPSAPRGAVIDVGGNDHLMSVETATAPITDLAPLGNGGWGIGVATHAQMCEVRARILSDGWPVGQIEMLPAQWTMNRRDSDGRPVDIRAHRPPHCIAFTRFWLTACQGRFYGAQDEGVNPADWFRWNVGPGSVGVHPSRRARRTAAATRDGSTGSASRSSQLLGWGWSVVTTSVAPGVSACSTANVHGDQASPWKYVGLPRSRQR